MHDAMDERRRGYEAKWAHDEELRFKVMARRDRLLGLWAAGEMGLSGEAAEAYARGVVAADLQEPGEEDVVRKLVKDLGAEKEKLVRQKMGDLLKEAREQLLKEMGT